MLRNLNENCAVRQDSIVKDLLLVSPTADASPWRFFVLAFSRTEKLCPEFINP
jgi:hypothetical protein